VTNDGRLAAAEYTIEVLDGEGVAVTQAGVRINFGYHSIASTKVQLAQAPAHVTDHGMPNFKIFHEHLRWRGRRFALPDVADGFLLRPCQAAAMHGGVVQPHAENIGSAHVLRERVLAADREGQGDGQPRMPRGRSWSKPTRFNASFRPPRSGRRSLGHVQRVRFDHSDRDVKKV